MVEPAHQRLPITAQCRLLRISRSSYCCAPVPETDETLALMTVIDETFMESSWYGNRQMARRLMAKIGLTPIYQRPRTSEPHPQHRVYPYLLRKLVIDRPDKVWCARVTYIPMRRGSLYLVAIMDWATRKVPVWRLSNTMDAGFCVAALEEAQARYGKPDIFNTDQGSQFTSPAFTTVLREAEVRINMGPGPVDGQRLHRAALAILEVRVRLSPCHQDRLGAAGWPRPLDHPLQHSASALRSGRENPGPGLSANRAIRSWGGINDNRD